MTAIGTVKYERAIKNEAGGYTYRDVTAEVNELIAAASDGAVSEYRDHTHYDANDRLDAALAAFA